MADGQEKEIPKAIEGLMTGVALFYDTLEAFLEPTVILPTLVSIFSYLHFWLWFKFYGIAFTSPKRAATFGTAFFIGFIPFLNALPETTLAVILILIDVRRRKAGLPPAAVNPRTVGTRLRK